MNKIRINELARELEVKAHEILDRLPELGVTEKKTHSSSIDEDVAIKLRRLLGGVVPAEYAEPEARAATPPEHPVAAVETSPALEVVPGGPLGQPPAPAAVEEMAPEPAAAKTAPDRPAGRPSLPIRPPLAGRWPQGAPPPATVPPPMAPAAGRCDCPRPSSADRGQPGSAGAARPGAVRTAPTDAARRQRTHLSVGADFHQTRCGCARSNRARIGGKPCPTRGTRRSDSPRAQTACATEIGRAA